MIDIFSQYVALPLITEISREANQAVNFKVIVCAGNEISEIEFKIEGKEPLANGEMRVIVKSMVDDVISFSAETIFNGLAENTGFSGFEINGKIVCEEEGRKMAVIRSRSNRYNVWDWGKKYRFSTGSK